MVGKIFITSTGYDPQRGKHVKDPYLGATPTLGACRPDLREQLDRGDHIFVVSGKIRDAPQYVMGGFEIDAKIDALTAYNCFPEHRLRMRCDGQLTGNIIVDASGRQHRLDGHKSFDRRIKNYVVGNNRLALTTEPEIAAGRNQTLEVLRQILEKNGESPCEVVGHYGSTLNDKQIQQLRDWLEDIKRSTN
jgi:hypothetical protein